MPIRNAIWTVSEQPQPLVEARLPSERVLEDMIVAAPRILSDEWMLIGRQERTGTGGVIDLLAIAPDGALVLIELKRDRTPREVVAQSIDYACWVEGLEADEIAAIYDRFVPGGSLAADFQARFGQPLDEDQLNQDHEIVIVATHLDDSSERIVEYLNQRGIPINVLCFQIFRHGPQQLLSRSWLLDPVETQVSVVTQAKRGAREREPWNGEFYACFGHGTTRSWDEGRRYGFICAGGGGWYSNTLNLLSIGDRVWVKAPGYGFVGVGEVTGPREPITEFTVATDLGERAALETLDGATYARHGEGPRKGPGARRCLESARQRVARPPMVPRMVSGQPRRRNWRRDRRSGAHPIGHPATDVLDRSRAQPWNRTMNVETTVQPADDIDDPEVAFEAMTRKLAGLTAAVEGFAARQQELHARDYGPDLVKIQEQWAEIVRAFKALKEKPGIALTPETLTPQIVEAGARVRAADHQAWGNANRELGLAIQSLNSVVASAMKAETQKHWIIGAATAALVAGFAFGTVVPTKIAQSVPESWHWPEQRAADLLQRNGWDAGMRLLLVADPAQFRALNDAAQLAQDDAVALADCRNRAEELQRGVQCKIAVGIPSTDRLAARESVPRQ